MELKLFIALVALAPTLGIAQSPAPFTSIEKSALMQQASNPAPTDEQSTVAPVDSKK